MLPRGPLGRVEFNNHQSCINQEVQGPNLRSPTAVGTKIFGVVSKVPASKELPYGEPFFGGDL